MTERPPTAAQIAAQALARSDENNAMLKEIHAAWMTPHAAYGDKSLLECVSTLVVEANAGRIVGKRLIFWGSVIVALGAIAAFLGLTGGPPK